MSRGLKKNWRRHWAPACVSNRVATAPVASSSRIPPSINSRASWSSYASTSPISLRTCREPFHAVERFVAHARDSLGYGGGLLRALGGAGRLDHSRTYGVRYRYVESEVPKIKERMKSG